MSAPSFTDLAPEYASDWARMIVLPSERGAADRMCEKIRASRSRYDTVEMSTRVPWYMVGLLHMRESDFDFSTHLHNGDSLSARTIHVPKGRPLYGFAPFPWVESAIDALRFDHLDDVGVWPLEAIAYRCESYNGFGPRRHGRRSGYLWAGSSIYDGGKYVEDRRWDPTVWDAQLGVMTVLRRMIDHGRVSLTPSATVAGMGRAPEDLQAALNRALAGVEGFDPLDVDGSVGRLTRAAVRLFQARSGLHVDGDAGPLTWIALDRAASPKLTV